MRLLLILPAIAATACAADQAPASGYAAIKSILDARCVECHGETKAKGGLRLDSHAATVKGSRDGAVVVAGKPDDSSLYTLVIKPASDEDKMPPKGERLSKEQTDAIKAWIAAGAKP